MVTFLLVYILPLQTTWLYRVCFISTLLLEPINSTPSIKIRSSVQMFCLTFIAACSPWFPPDVILHLWPWRRQLPGHLFAEGWMLWNDECHLLHRTQLMICVYLLLMNYKPFYTHRKTWWPSLSCYSITKDLLRHPWRHAKYFQDHHGFRPLSISIVVLILSAIAPSLL